MEQELFFLFLFSDKLVSGNKRGYIYIYRISLPIAATLIIT